MKQWVKTKKKRIKQLNDTLDKIIDKSKSFEEQIKSIRKIENLNEYRCSDDYGDKELKFKYSKLKLAYMLNEIGKKLFEQIIGLTLEKLANRLINTKNKEENQIIVKNINENNKKKLYEEGDFRDYVIQPTSRRVILVHAINLILDFNEAI